MLTWKSFKEASMDDDIEYKTRIYTDMQGLKQLEYAKDKVAAKKEVSQQFEALMMQMVFRSMREASKPFSSGLFDSNQMELYQDMFDKQLSLMLSNSNIGFAKMIEKNIDQIMENQAHPRPPKEVSTGPVDRELIATAPALTTVDKPSMTNLLPMQVNKQFKKSIESPEQNNFSTPEEFVQKLWSVAKSAAGMIGASPGILLAQAALETNWGRNILNNEQTGSSHNLFNIKAGSNWNNKVTTAITVEQNNGVLVKEKSNFRSYDSFKESFLDYINVLKKNERYNDALNKTSDPKQFIQALHNAGYATDPNYSEKILKIFSSKSFQNLISKLKNI